MLAFWERQRGVVLPQIELRPMKPGVQRRKRDSEDVEEHRHRHPNQGAEDNEERIEWFPVPVETQNFLRYSAEFLEKARDVTLVHFSQMVELRRRSARDLHMLAGLAGETIISNEMTKKITEMIRVFINRAKEKLES